ncbi:hypothetical protein Mapa_000617 [Marchantia paleacea]|nr:hypothetical protein Mapa_000617 [Marchantia paleacea]
MIVSTQSFEADNVAHKKLRGYLCKCHARKRNIKKGEDSINNILQSEETDALETSK